MQKIVEFYAELMNDDEARRRPAVSDRITKLLDSYARDSTAAAEAAVGDRAEKLAIKPTFFGERHAPDDRAELRGLSSVTMTLSEVSGRLQMQSRTSRAFSAVWRDGGRHHRQSERNAARSGDASGRRRTTFAARPRNTSSFC